MKLCTVVLPQLGLLAFWTAAADRYWHLRLAASALFILLSSALFLIADRALAEVATLMAVYYGAVVVVGVVRRLVRAAYARRLGASADAPRFSMGQLMAVMTVVAIAAAATSFLAWPLSSSDVPVLLVLVAIPIVSRVLFDLSPNSPLALLLLLGAGLLTQFLPVELRDFSWWPILAQYAFCGIWLWGVRVRPDARRRLADRRRRRAPRHSVVAAANESQAADMTREDVKTIDTRA